MDGNEKVEKSYVGQVSGNGPNSLDPQVLVTQTSPAVDPAANPARPGGPNDPGKLQPGETIAGSTGDMVTTTPSGSGTAQMIPGAGSRS